MPSPNPTTRYTLQELLNLSFDKGKGVLGIELLGYDSGSDALIPIKVDSNGVLQTNASSLYGPIGATYVTLSTNSSLTNERVLTGTTNQVSVTDNGAGSTVVLALPQSIDTAATPTFGGINLNGLETITRTGLGTTTTAGEILQNTTAATVGTQTQYSPATEWVGHSWHTLFSADRTHRFRAELRPSSGTASTLALMSSIDTGTASWTDRLTLTASGLLTTDSATHATLTVSGLTAGRVPYVSTGGLITNEDNFEYDATNNKLYVPRGFYIDDAGANALPKGVFVETGYSNADAVLEFGINSTQGGNRVTSIQGGMFRFDIRNSVAATAVPYFSIIRQPAVSGEIFDFAIDTTGRVGIGRGESNSYGATVDILGKSTSQFVLKVQGTASHAFGLVEILSGAGVRQMIIENDGRVGIGPSISPSQLLHVQRNTDAITRILLENTNTGSTAQASLVLIGGTSQWEFIVKPSISTSFQFYSGIAGDFVYDFSTTGTFNIKGATPIITTQSNRILTIEPNGSGYTRIGTVATTSHTLNTNDDLLVTGRLEVDGVSWFDATSTAVTVDVANDVRARQLVADGDSAGTASTTTLTNGSETLGLTEVTILNDRNESLTHTGYIKLYLGTQDIWVPYMVISG
jgi:hypothetical protein